MCSTEAGLDTIPSSPTSRRS